MMMMMPMVMTVNVNDDVDDDFSQKDGQPWSLAAANVEEHWR